MDYQSIDIQKYLSPLLEIQKIFESNNGEWPAFFINELIDSIKNGDREKFFRRLNSVEFWGGAGAIWEAYVQPTDINELNANLCLLLKYMNKDNTLEKRAKLRSKDLGCNL